MIRLMQLKYLLISFVPIVIVSLAIAKMEYFGSMIEVVILLIVTYIVFRLSVAIVRLTNFPIWAKKAGKLEIEFIENFKSKNPIESTRLGLDSVKIYYLYHYYSLKRLIKGE